MTAEATTKHAGNTGKLHRNIIPTQRIVEHASGKIEVRQPNHASAFLSVG